MPKNNDYKSQKAKLEERDRALQEEERKLDAEGSAGGSGERQESGTSEEGFVDEQGQDANIDDPNALPPIDEDLLDEDLLEEDGEQEDGEQEESEEGQEEQVDGEQENDEEGQESEEEQEESDENNEEEQEEEEQDEEEEEQDKEKPEDVDSESRKNLGPNRGDNKDGDDKSPDKDKKDSGADDKAGQDDKKGPTTSVKDAAKEELKKRVGSNETIAKAQEIATKAVAAVKGATSGIAFVGKMLINPVFWIVVAALIILAAVSSTVTVVGGNDFNKACDANGIGSVNVAIDADDFTRQSAIASWLMTTPFEVTGGQPMNKEQASAVLGNFMLESYMANPKAMQDDPTIVRWQTCGNDCVGAWQGRGKAVGLAQWMGGRRMGLVEFARSEGTEWHDLTTQLKFLKKELDGGEGQNLKNAGFGSPTLSLEDYTWLWQDEFERAGESRTSVEYLMRENYAKQFYQDFTGSGVSIGSLATQCVGGAGSVDASSLVQLALDISYTREEKSAGLGRGSCSSLVQCGQSFAKPEYITAKQMAEDQTGTDPFPGLVASCDRMAATLYRLTGIDPNFPWGSTGTQIDYMNNPSNGWVPVTCQERQPGDAIARVGHIMVYIGMIDGRDTIASASIATAPGGGRAAHLSDLSCEASGLFRADGMSVGGWRKVD